MDEDEIIKRAEELTAKVMELQSSDKYEKASRILASANAALLITLIWKSLELSTGISWLAKISMIFFLLGTIAIFCRYIFDYLGEGVSRRPLFKEISNFFETHKDTLQRTKPEEFENWEMLSKTYKLAEKTILKLANQNQSPNGVIVGVYLLLDFVSFLISGIAFCIGCFLLLASAIAS